MTAQTLLVVLDAPPSSFGWNLAPGSASVDAVLMQFAITMGLMKLGAYNSISKLAKRSGLLHEFAVRLALLFRSNASNWKC